MDARINFIEAPLERHDVTMTDGALAAQETALLI